jgi:hypothetical protein
VLEKQIEAHLVKRVKEAGGIAYKFTSPQRRSVPDRLVLLDIAKAAEEVRALLTTELGWCALNEEELEEAATRIVAASMHFVETKATGCKPTPMQEREHTRLRAMGFVVRVLDDKGTIDAQYKNG